MQQEVLANAMAIELQYKYTMLKKRIMFQLNYQSRTMMNQDITGIQKQIHQQ